MRLLKTALRLGVSFGLPMGLLFFFMSGRVAVGLVSGVGAGVLYGVPMTLFFWLLQTIALRPFKDEQNHFEPGEQILHSGPANRWTAKPRRFGKLYLTPRRLRFRSVMVVVRLSKRLNEERLPEELKDVTMPLPEIAQARVERMWGIFGSILVVTLRSGEVQRYKIEEQAAWRRALSAAGVTVN
jgi:hypothetical protein